MLNIKRDSNRPIEKGQYWVELVDFETGNQFGYWCDRAHLKTIAREILKEFQYEIVGKLLE